MYQYKEPLWETVGAAVDVAADSVLTCAGRTIAVVSPDAKVQILVATEME